MLKFSKKVEYALIALDYMSKKLPGELTTARELSEKFNISLDLMGKILQNLARSQMIVSVQGVRGGYYLNKSEEEISVSSVIKAVDGPFKLVDCVHDNGPSKCGRDKNCAIKKSMERIQSKLESLFDEITLKDFHEKFK